MVKPVPEALYPFEGQRKLIGGHSLHYLDEGSGDPVVMVHGNPTWSFFWRNLVLGLRANHRCIVPDHIGCGLSDKPALADYPYTLQRRVEDLEALLDSLDLNERVTLVAHDWGGMIGMAVAHRRPERIARLVLMNTGAFPLPAEKAMPTRLSIVRDSRLGAFLVTRFNAFAKCATWMAVEQPLPPEIARAYVAPYDTPDNRIATLRFVQDIPLAAEDPGYALVDEVGREMTSDHGDKPALLVWGAKDWVFDDHFLAGFQKRLPQAETLRFADAGHYVLEDATEAVVARVQAFLAAHPLPSSGGAQASS